MRLKWTSVTFLIVAVIAVIYLLTSTNGTLSKRSSNFSIENTLDISKIIIDDGSQELILTKENQHWIVNGKYQVKDWNINNFLTALNRLDVLSPVSKAENDQIKMLLQKDGIKVEIFKGKRSLKSYYVSKPDMNKSKTYMLMKRSKQAFVIRIPLFKGHVSDLFFADETYWRNKVVFNFKPQELKNITVEFQNNSYTATNYNDGSFSLTSNKNTEIDFKVEQLAKYFTFFQNINFESVLKGQDQAYVDSVLSSEPFADITITDFSGHEKNLKLYRKPAVNLIDEFGEKAKFDYHKAYGVINNSNEIILIPYHNIDLILKEIDYFR